ncbi:MAG: hypothetical protein D6796_14705, partial [Caldilineae bacterium]
LSHVLVEPQKAQQLLDFYRLFQPGTPGNIIGLMIGGYVGGAAMRHSRQYPRIKIFPVQLYFFFILC